MPKHKALIIICRLILKLILMIQNFNKDQEFGDDIKYQMIQQFLCMLRQPQYSKYLELITSMTAHQQRKYYQMRDKVDRYESSRSIDLYRKDGLNFPKKSTKQYQLQHNSFSQGEIFHNNSERSNLYQLYCSQLFRKKNDRNYLINLSKKNKNHHYSNAFEKVKLRQQTEPAYLNYHKSKAINISNNITHANKNANNKSSPKDGYTKCKAKVQPQELNIGTINNNMPKLPKKRLQISNVRKGVKLGATLKKARQDREMLVRSNKISGWEALEDEQFVYFDD